MDLQTPIGKLAMIGPIYKRRLEKLEIYTCEDLLYHFPFRYDDFSIIAKVATLQEGEIVTIQGKIVSIKNEYSFRRKFLQKAQISDDTGTIAVVWFNQTFLTKTLTPGTLVNLSGKVSIFKNALTLVSPEYEVIETADSQVIHTGRLVPIYPETYGTSSKWLRRNIQKLLSLCETELIEYLSKDIINRNQLLPFDEAIKEVHFPKNWDLASKARERLAFDELFLMQIKSFIRKREWEQNRIGHSFSIAKYKKEISEFWKQLPFELTDAQKKAVKEIFADLAKKRPMNRLLEGDVGSGKTVVAAIAMYIAFLNGYQSALMAPTEILAQQHFDTISKLLTPLGVDVNLITGSSKYKVSSIKDKKQGKILNTKYLIQNTNILIGTHALLSESTQLDRLALIVIDEQHRFGVEQRALLFKKGGKTANPHVLTMTATPIPRTVALTMYGNLDLSYLDEMPKGRIPVKTWVVEPEKREKAYEWIASQIKNEHAQVFIICPFIEESETLVSVKAATKEYERLKKEVFTRQKLGLLHGKMKAKEKEEAITKFREGRFEILVATPVVEVGIDIPGATIMVIEGSERFGLAQLHQLRGRVGRSSKQSYCLIFTESQSQNSLKRLKSLEKIHVGAVLSELDLKLRGPGELHGTKQHGVPKLKIASFSDIALIDKTKTEAQFLLKNDPNLSKTPLLQDKLKTYTIKAVEPN